MGRHRVKPRRQRQPYKIYNDDEVNPLVNLATAIVNQAVRDALAVGGKGTLDAPKEAYGVNKYELLNFFRSKWCGILRGCTDLEAEALIERTGLNELFNS